MYIDIFDCIKIGYSINTKKRIMSLCDELYMRYGLYPEISILKTKLFKDTDSAKFFESKCHSKFKDFYINPNLNFGGKTELFDKACLNSVLDYFNKEFTYEYYNPYCALEVSEDEKVKVKDWIRSKLSCSERQASVKGLDLISKNLKANHYLSRLNGVDALLFNCKIYSESFRTIPSTAFRAMKEIPLKELNSLFDNYIPVPVKLPDYAFNKIKSPIWNERFERLKLIWEQNIP